MSTKTFTVEQIISKLREAEVALSRGQTVQEVCRTLGIHDATYYRWRQIYGGLKVNQAKVSKNWLADYVSKMGLSPLSLQKQIMN